MARDSCRTPGLPPPPKQRVDVFDFRLTEDQMSRITTLDTGTSLFFDHRDPAMVSRLGTTRLDD
ncbi:hypothetical protein [Streptomyces sp. ISL-100]|uniref:hypothetical protein n=1 Tax=Streptomyces sp. ISL-100 TaxID=2819173 RepID=UPI0027E3D9E8|nr:hypothetical protein [Streptomyces sp. ISL-100]